MKLNIADNLSLPMDWMTLATVVYGARGSGKTTLGATFSDCGGYRYRLWRTWGRGEYLNGILLNPSTATHMADDPTITRMGRRAKNLGFTGLQITNLFAWRATDPHAMLSQSDPVGPDNDEQIIEVARGAGMVLCGWGLFGKKRGRAEAVISMLQRAGVKLHCLWLCADGSPKHPLYCGYDLKPIPFRSLSLL